MILLIDCADGLILQYLDRIGVKRCWGMALRTVMSYLSNSGITCSEQRGSDNLFLTIKKIQIIVIKYIIVSTEVAIEESPNVSIIIAVCVHVHLLCSSIL
jgi:hypothetical protein